MRKTLFIAPLALALATTPALADPPPWAPAHGAREKHVYDGYGRYVEPRPITRNSYIWRGRDGRYYCRRDNGTTGLVGQLDRCLGGGQLRPVRRGRRFDQQRLARAGQQREHEHGGDQHGAGFLSVHDLLFLHWWVDCETCI